MNKIFIPDTQTPGGHYTPAIISHGLVFTSGILPINPKTGEKLLSETFEDQTSLIFKNLEDILLSAGSSLQKLVKVNVFLKDINDWASFNNLYSQMLGDHKPARTVVPVSDLHFGFLIELEAIAEI